MHEVRVVPRKEIAETIERPAAMEGKTLYAKG